MDKKPDAPLEAAKEGFVLTPAFAEILAEVYEKQDVVLRLCFPDLVAHLDFKREEKRFDNFQFASEASWPDRSCDGRETAGAYGRRINAR